MSHNITLFERSNDVNIKYRERQNKKIEKHWHRFIEIELISAGGGMHKINGNSYPLKRGEMHILKLTDIHELSLEDDCALYLIQLPTTYLPAEMNSAILNCTSDMVVYWDGDELAGVDRLFRILLEESKREDSYSADIIKNTVMTLCLLFFRKLNVEKASVHRNGSNRINDIIIFIQNNFRRPLSVTGIAECFYMNSEYFTKYFKKHMGIGPREYLTAVRMEHAKKLVCQSNMKIIDIAMDCGYGSVTTFLRDFKQKYNCTPKQMRENP